MTVSFAATELAAGLPSTMEEVGPLLERLGQRLFMIGEDAALANLVKLAANVLTATTLEYMGEVLALPSVASPGPLPLRPTP